MFKAVKKMVLDEKLRTDYRCEGRKKIMQFEPSMIVSQIENL